MYGLFRVSFDPWINNDLVCVSKSVESLVHHYNCLDRDETRGKKLLELPFDTVDGLQGLMVGMTLVLLLTS